MQYFNVKYQLLQMEWLQSDQGGFQLLDLIITELANSHDRLKIQGLSLVEILFVKKKSFTRFALQSECCNFDQWEVLNYNKSCDF